MQSTTLLLVFALTFVPAVALAARGGEPPCPPPPPAEYPPDFARGIQRTMTLLAAGTPERRHPVKVLFYGQSITNQEWTQEVARWLRETFPHADLTIENRSIGGFASQRLCRTAKHDLYPFYPDLMIFHVLGDHRRYEDIIRETRSRTTAEIAIWNDHVTQYPVPEDCWEEKMSYDYIPGFARKYGCFLMDVRTEWKQYLDATGLDAAALLRDGVHLNDCGNYVLGELIKRRLRHNPDLPDDDWRDTVRTYEVGTDVQWQDGRIALEFDGNRVDLLSARRPGDTPGTARVLIDGKAPSEFPELYVIERVSGTANIGWPAIQRVSWQTPLVLETWTARVTEINDACDTFTFDVEGSVTGPDGSGISGERFVSRSGRVVIEPDDWVLAYDRQVSGKPTPPGFECRWRVVPAFTDLYEAPVVEDPAREYAVTAAQGLTNSRHALELVAVGDQPPVAAIRVYEPPVK
jgi:hypothetical protein